MFLAFAVFSLPLVALGAYYIFGANGLSAANPSHSPKTYKVSGIISLVLAGILLVSGIVVSIIIPDPYYGRTSSSSSTQTTDVYGHDKFDAFVIAKEIVKERLKSPSTAKFCSTSNATFTLHGDTWTVRGYVDAQNSFGSTIRNNFMVMFTFSSSNRYTIDLVDITE